MISRDTNIKRALQARSSPRSRQRGYLLNPYNFGSPQQPGDPHWGSVSAYMRFDGEEDGTVFTDEKGKVWTRTGNVVTKNLNGDFNRSAYFDGAGGSLSVATSSDFTFGTGDFTIDIRGRCVNVAANRVLFSFDNNRTLYYATNGVFYFYDGSGNILSSGSNVYNTWESFSLERKEGLLTLYKNGAVMQSVSWPVNITSNNMFVGNNTVLSGPMYGDLDEFRVTKGVARHNTTAYTPEVGPFSNYG